MPPSALPLGGPLINGALFWQCSTCNIYATNYEMKRNILHVYFQSRKYSRTAVALVALLLLIYRNTGAKFICEIFYTQTVSNASFIYSKAFCDLATISLQACQQTTASLNEFQGLFTLKSLAQVKLRNDRITSCGYLRFAFTFSTSCGFLRVGFWKLLALGTSCW